MIDNQEKTTVQCEFELKAATVGDSLITNMAAVLNHLPQSGPQYLATHLNVNKVLTSRLLKAYRSQDPLTVLHRTPGPEPLRRILKASAKNGVPKQVIRDANEAVDSFERLLREDVGDRSALDTIVSTWIPEARREFEVRRKQTIFRAFSQLKGVEMNTRSATVILSPSIDNKSIDVTWIMGLIGVKRLRPNVRLDVSTQRMVSDGSNRFPTTLEGLPVTAVKDLHITEFCSSPLPTISIKHSGSQIHYSMCNADFGRATQFDLVYAEVNRSEIPRPTVCLRAENSPRRKAHFYATCHIPAKVLQFDLFVHEDLYESQSPELLLFDTARGGVADINDPSQMADQLDMMESVTSLGRGIGNSHSPDVPRYTALLQHSLNKLSLDEQSFRGYRCRIDYPLYTCQVVLAFDAV